MNDLAYYLHAEFSSQSMRIEFKSVRSDFFDFLKLLEIFCLRKKDCHFNWKFKNSANDLLPELTFEYGSSGIVGYRTWLN